MRMITDNIKIVNLMIRQANLHSSEEIQKKLDKITVNVNSKIRIDFNKEELKDLVHIIDKYVYLHKSIIDELRLHDKTPLIYDIMALQDDINIHNKDKYLEYLELNYNSLLNFYNKLLITKKEFGLDG